MKKTKIIATISDFKCDVDFLKELFDAGMNAVRINTAHSTFEGALQIVENTRKVSDKIAIILDTKGPEIRTTSGEIRVNEGDRILVRGEDKELEDGCIYVTYGEIVKDLDVGSSIMINDGSVEMIVVEKNSELVCEVKSGGTIKGRMNVNVPGVRRNLPALQEMDKKYIKFANDKGIDFIAHSFVRNIEDIQAVKKIIDGPKLIAKIENQEGVNNIDAIIDSVYGVMIARGDLGIEVAEEKIPGIQKTIIRKCIENKKPVIVATQMLHSMIDNPRATRAEVSDVANSIYDGTDAVMLSGETAIGKYPVKAVQTMARIAEEVEKNSELFIERIEPIDDDIADFLADSAVRASFCLDTRAIIADTVTGRTGRFLAACRGKDPVFCMCYDKKVMRALAISYSVYAYFMEPRNSSDQFISKSLEVMGDKLDDEDVVVILAGSFGPRKGASFVEISRVGDLKEVFLPIL